MVARRAEIGASGELHMRLVPKVVKAPLSWKLKNFFQHYWKSWWKAELATRVARITGHPVMIGSLKVRVRNNVTGQWIDYGEVCRRVVTDAGVAFIVDAFDNTVEAEIMKYHGFGTGGTAEAAGQTALVTELTTQYATDNTRPTGTQAQPSANVYRTVGTLDPDADVAITEHAILSQAATGGGTMLDRSLFSVINVTGAGANTLEATYDLTLTSGS